MSEISPIVELRRYALRPGARDTLIELFDREFVESQEAVGMRILGQFRDLDDPDSFVWLRGFSDMRSRRRALEAFYGGPDWRQHAQAANATMLDVDNVLLLRPISGLALDTGGRPVPGSHAEQAGLLVVTIYPLAAARAGDFADFYAREVGPALAEQGVALLATYATEHSPNTFPALPVRDDADVFVSMTMFSDEADHAQKSGALDGLPAKALVEHVDGRVEILRLRPTARSLLHA